MDAMHPPMNMPKAYVTTLLHLCFKNTHITLYYTFAFISSDLYNKTKKQ